MPDALAPARPAPAARPAPLLSASAMSLDDYARVVQSRTLFVDFLLAPARDRAAAAA